MVYVKETYLKNKLVKVKRSLEATVEGIQHHALLIIRKKPRYMIIHAGTNPSWSNSKKICSRFLQPKKDKLPDIELISSTAALRTGNGKALLILRQVTKYLVKLNIEIFDKHKARENALVFENVGDEKNHHPGGRNFFCNPFSGYILFCSLVSFAYFVFLLFLFILFYFILFYFCLFVCFLKIKIYVPIQIRLCGRMNDKKKFTRPISGSKITFFWPNIQCKHLSKTSLHLDQSGNFWTNLVSIW